MDKTTVIAINLLLLLFVPFFPTPKTQGGNSVYHKLTCFSSDDATGDFWTTRRPMPTARSRFGVAVVNGKIYAIGGYNGSYLNVNEMYDPTTDTWTRKRPMPTPRCLFGIAVYQNKIYVIGGQVGFDEVAGKYIFCSVNEVYDPLTDTWEIRKPMPTARGGLTANVVNGKIYLIGGTADWLHALSVNEVYDPAADTWTTKEPMPKAVMDYASAVVDDKIYVISGADRGYPTNLTQIYNPETDTWSYGAQIPIAVMGAAAGATTGVLAPKKIYVIGGSGIVTCNLNQVYDAEKDSWTNATRMPTSRGYLAVAVIDDLLYAIGGDSGWTFNFYGTNEQYTPIGYLAQPLIISVLSPENKTYHVNYVPLTFTVNKPTLWMGYSLDGQANVTITGNTTLIGLSDGTHSLTVYATDTAGYTSASETIYFSIKTQQSEPFPLLWVAAAIAVTAIGGAVLIIHFAKIKKATTKPK